MITVGFEDVVETQILAPISHWPVDPWDKQLGCWVCVNGLKAAESFGKVMIVGGLPEAEAPDMIARLKHDLTDGDLRVYSPRECPNS